MYQSGRAGDEAKKRKSPAKSGRVGIYESNAKFQTKFFKRRTLWKMLHIIDSLVRGVLPISWVMGEGR